MRLLCTFSFVLFVVTISFGQSFTLPELIKMSQMDVDDFDTYVTRKGFVFHYEIDNDQQKLVEYEYPVIKNDFSKANKSLTLYQQYSEYGFKHQYHISYSTLDKKEYNKFKNQLKSLGYIFKSTKEWGDGDLTKSYQFESATGRSGVTISVDYYKSYMIECWINF